MMIIILRDIVYKNIDYGNCIKDCVSAKAELGAI